MEIVLHSTAHVFTQNICYELGSFIAEFQAVNNCDDQSAVPALMNPDNSTVLMGNDLANSDPRNVDTDLMEESVTIDELEEFQSYLFTVLVATVEGNASFSEVGCDITLPDGKLVQYIPELLDGRHDHHTHMHTHTCTHTHAAHTQHAHTHMHTHVHTHPHTNIHTYTYTYVHIIYMYMQHVSVFTYKVLFSRQYSLINPLYTHTTHTFTYTHIYTCTHLVPSSPPGNVTFTITSNTTADVMWNAPPVLDQNGIITSYTVNITNLETHVPIIMTTPNARTLLPIEGTLPSLSSKYIPFLTYPVVFSCCILR